ncbi:hypothetical protein [Candidatus Chlorohelix sp.]|uniref:hypothetical protein n=1 Tax=Candidatus Chlorohelix sp. TaxID=3139201 RepID=UPI0030302510
MIAFALSIGIFIFWTALGFAFLSIFQLKSSSIQNLLLAPALGLAVTLLPVFFLNRLGGIPVKYFGVILVLLLLFLIGILFWRFRPNIPIKLYLPFGIVLLLAAVITGRPLFEFGFNWMSYYNDDSSLYISSAYRVLNFGFDEPPNLDSLISSSDNSAALWFLYSVSGHRAGSDWLLALLSSITGMMPDQIYMPLIMAMHITLISTSGALIYQTPKLRMPALVLCIMLAFSALTSLGTAYQLMPQVGGLSILILCLILLSQIAQPDKRWSIIWYCILISISVSALLVDYPEIFPFLVLSYGLYLGVGFIKKLINWKILLTRLSFASFFVLIILNTYIIKVVGFLINQTTIGTGSVGSSGQLSYNTTVELMFPYYLIPSGLADLWGFQNIASIPNDPWLTISIILGAFLLILAIIAIIWSCWRLQLVAFPALVMLLMAAFLFIKTSDFGLFKLAMYIQPFLLGSVVAIWFYIMRKHPKFALIPLIFLVCLGIPFQYSYIERSRGTADSGFGLLEIPNPSATGIHQDFRTIINQNNPSQVILDTNNFILAKFQSLYMRNQKVVSFPGVGLFYWRIVLKGKFDDDFSKYAQIKVADRYRDAEFNLFSTEGNPSTTAFSIDAVLTKEFLNNSTMISPTPRLSIFNRRKFLNDNSINFIAQPTNKLENHLVFIPSSLGMNYYGGNSDLVSLFQLESDLLYPGKTMAGLGRYYIFEPINPSPSVRLVMELTDSLSGDHENLLPSASAIGVTRQPFPIVGRGSARVFSEPITPQIIQNQPFLGIDMGKYGKYFPNPKNGIMELFGKQILLDKRKILGFARDISLVSIEEYDQLKAPEVVSQFPSDLTNPNLEYSGVYEDGWISEAAFFRLAQPTSTAKLVIKGTIPLIDNQNFTSNLEILSDGILVATKQLPLGDFEIQLPVTGTVANHRIDLRFSKFQTLPGNDGRPVAALIKYVGYEK